MAGRSLGSLAIGADSTNGPWRRQYPKLAAVAGDCVGLTKRKVHRLRSLFVIMDQSR